MKQNIEITERDIYKFVFSQETLELEKKTYLESNLERFQHQIDYCRQLQNLSIEEPQEKTIINIVNKVLSPNVIELIPSVRPTETRDSKLRLSAESLNLEKKNYSYTFTDTNSEHVIKIINTASESLLYFFSSAPTENAKITLLPSGSTYTIIDTYKPIEILEEKVIQKILISY